MHKVLYEWDLDGDGVFGETGANAERGDETGINPTFSAAGLDGPSSVTVSLRVTDGGGLSDEDTATIAINNVAPTLSNVAVTSPIDENDTATLTGNIADPGTADTFSLVVDWGDSSAPQTFNYPAGTAAFNETHQYLDDNPSGTPSDNYTISVTVSDDDTGSDIGTASVTVNNVAPTVSVITAPIDPVEVSTPINASASFSDPGTADTHDAEWDWGDDTTTTQEDVTSPALASHTYTEAGVYTVRLIVTDDDGDFGESTYQYVVVYDPDGGFVTGGGWINSPEGAYAPDPSLTGKATFGFVAKYKKGADTPTGQTEFRFRVADLNFHSDTYQWLVVAGHKAMFKGTGTINGAGNYGFMLSAIDEKLTPSTDVDLFRIKIWNRDNGDTIVYDNQMGDSDDAEPTTAIGGGSIVIHKAK